MATTLTQFRDMPDEQLLLHGKEVQIYSDAFVIALIERFEDKCDALAEAEHQTRMGGASAAPQDKNEALEYEIEDLRETIRAVRRLVI